MARKTNFLSLFNVMPGEGKSASLMLLHSFFMGVATVYFETAATVHFLTRFSEKHIPYAYVAAAVATTLTGIVYAKVRERMSFSRLMLATLAFLAVFVGAFRLGLSFAQAGWLVFGLMIWYRILSLLTDLEYWAVASRLYDVRQSKRLFPFIGTGEVAARILGAFSIPVLVTFMPVKNLLILSMLGLVVCIVLLTIIVRSFPDELTHEEPQHASETQARGGLWQKLRNVAKSRYLMMMLAMTVFGVLGKYFVDFAFLEQMQGRYGGEASLAKFFGLFSGITQTVNFLARVSFSGRLLNRFGLRFGLLALPLLHALCTSVILLAGSLFGGTGLVFWLVIANQGIYKTVKHPVDNPSFKILYQPLSKRAKLSVQIIMELLVTPVALGVAGVIMILASTLIPYSPVSFSYIMFLSFAAWVVVAYFLANKEYPKALLVALKARILDGTSLTFTDKSSVAAIKERLWSERPRDVIFALHLLEEAAPEEFTQQLTGFLKHAAPEVRDFAIQGMAKHQLTSAAPALLAHAEAEANPGVRASALRAAGTLGGAALAPRLHHFLEIGDNPSRAGAMLGLLAAADASAAVQDLLRHWATSERSEERRLAARVLGAASCEPLTPLLRDLLDDPDRATRRDALQAAGECAAPELLPALLDNLSQPLFCGTAAAALIAMGNKGTEALTAFRDRHAEDPAIQLRAARILGRTRGPKAKRALLAAVQQHHPGVREGVLKALSQCGLAPKDGPSRERIEALIQNEAEWVTWLLSMLDHVERAGNLDTLHAALEHEWMQGRHRLLLLLSFLFDSAAILSAHANLHSSSKVQRAYALEVLDVALPQEMRAVLLPMVLDKTTGERLEILQRAFPQERHEGLGFLSAIIDRRDGAASPWTRATAIHAAAGATDAKEFGRIKRCTRSALDLEPNPWIRETAEWLLAAVDGASAETAAGTRRTPMLTIEKAMVLKSGEIFSRIPDETLAELASVLEEVEFEAGETLFHKDDAGDSLYVIASGRIRIHDGDETITTLGEGDVLGEMSVLDQEPRSASASAEEDALLLKLDRDMFFEVMADHRQVADGIIHVLCSRIRESNQQRVATPS